MLKKGPPATHTAHDIVTTVSALFAEAVLCAVLCELFSQSGLGVYASMQPCQHPRCPPVCVKGFQVSPEQPMTPPTTQARRVSLLSRALQFGSSGPLSGSNMGSEDEEDVYSLCSEDGESDLSDSEEPEEQHDSKQRGGQTPNSSGPINIPVCPDSPEYKTMLRVRAVVNSRLWAAAVQGP